MSRYSRMFAVLTIVLSLPCCFAFAQSPATQDTIADASKRVVKLYGAGGVRSLEAYQTGVLISADGHVLTVWSYVLDTDAVRATLDDGRKYEAKLVGANPEMEIAVLKIDAADLPHFTLADAAAPNAGERIFALSNLFGVATGEEPVSAQRGVITARTRLDARKGVFQSPYRGEILVTDAVTNNPGAAGGAIVDAAGKFVGLIGKELRNSQNGSWLSYAIPAGALRQPVADILEGKQATTAAASKVKPEDAHSLVRLGIGLVPDLFERTPPFVDEIVPASLAAQAGLQRDDLVVFVGDALTPSCRAVREELARRDRLEPVRVVVKRGVELVEVTLSQP